MRAVTPGIINATLKAKEDGKTALHELQGEPWALMWARAWVVWLGTRDRNGSSAVVLLLLQLSYPS
jgi:hypothetical protein